MSYRDKIRETIDEVEGTVAHIQGDTSDILKGVEKLSLMLNQEEYDTDLAMNLINLIERNLEVVVENLKELGKELY